MAESLKYGRGEFGEPVVWRPGAAWEFADGAWRPLSSGIETVRVVSKEWFEAEFPGLSPLPAMALQCLSLKSKNLNGRGEFGEPVVWRPGAAWEFADGAWRPLSSGIETVRVVSKEWFEAEFPGLSPLPAMALQCLSLKSKNLKLLAGPSNIDGDVARIVKLSDGSARIERWEKGVGWVEAPKGAFTPDEFTPGACRPVSGAMAARLGIPPSDLGLDAGVPESVDD